LLRVVNKKSQYIDAFFHIVEHVPLLWRLFSKGAITSNTKHAIKLKTSPARLAQRVRRGCKLKQNANESCNSCASLARLVLSFIACFILLVIAP